MVAICEMCGVTGFADCLIICSKCKHSAQHRYCLDEFLASDSEDIWLCEQCKPKDSEKDSVSKLNWKGDTKEIGFRKSGINCAAKVFRIPDKENFSCLAGKLGQSCEVASTRQPCIEITKHVTKSEGLRGNNTLPKEEERNSQSCDKRIEGDNAKKKRRRMLILDDDDSSDEENKPSKVSTVTKECTKSRDLISIVAHPTFLDVAPLELSEHQAVEQVCDARDAPLNILCHQTSVDDYHGDVYARPIVDPIWRGSFAIQDKTYGAMVAHLSSKACSRVCERAKMLPPLLCMEKLPRSDAWPISFQRSPPNDDSIALYFFVESGRGKTMFDQLLEDIIRCDLTLKVPLDDAELLIFSSLQLPTQHWRFLESFYLWGVFRGRQVPSINQTAFQLVDHVKTGNNSQDSCEREPVKLELSEEEMDRSEICNQELFVCNEQDEKDAASMELVSLDIDGGGIDDNDMYVPCQELFPLGTEDIAIKARLGGSSELDLNLDLGIGRAATNYSGFVESKLVTQAPCTASDKELFESWQKFTSSLRCQSHSKPGG